MRGERVLVTGGAGFIGSSLVEKLAPESDVVVLDDLSTGTLANLGSVRGRLHLIKASVFDRGEVLRASRGCSIVYHLAALTSVPESFLQQDRYSSVNVLGTANVLAAALQVGCKAFVFASSCAVYGPKRVRRVSESARPNPKSPYAATKLAGEQLCDAAGASGISVVKLRVFNAFGPRQAATSTYSSVIARFVGAVVANRPVEVYGSGNQSRDFVHVHDVADALQLAARFAASSRREGDVFNIGTGRAHSVNDVISVLEEATGRSISRVSKPKRPGDVVHSCADTTKARRVLGFAHRVSFAEGIKSLYLAQEKKRQTHN